MATRLAKIPYIKMILMLKYIEIYYSDFPGANLHKLAVVVSVYFFFSFTCSLLTKIIAHLRLYENILLKISFTQNEIYGINY